MGVKNLQESQTQQGRFKPSPAPCCCDAQGVSPRVLVLFRSFHGAVELSQLDADKWLARSPALVRIRVLVLHKKECPYNKMEVSRVTKKNMGIFSQFSPFDHTLFPYLGQFQHFASFQSHHCNYQVLLWIIACSPFSYTFYIVSTFALPLLVIALYSHTLVEQSSNSPFPLTLRC